MSDALVFPMEEQDIPAVSKMFIALHEHLNGLGSLFKLNPDWLSDYLHMMLDSRLGRVIVLKLSDEVVGFICVSTPIINKKFISEGSKNTGFISELFVDSAHRGKAYAKILLSAAEDFFKSLNIRYMQVEVLVNNETAASLYKNYGFTPSYTNLYKNIQE